MLFQQWTKSSDLFRNIVNHWGSNCLLNYVKFHSKVLSLAPLWFLGLFTRNFDRALLILLEKYLCYSRSYEFQDCWSPQGSATIGSFFVFLLWNHLFWTQAAVQRRLIRKWAHGISVPHKIQELNWVFHSVQCWIIHLWVLCVVYLMVLSALGKKY